LNQCPASPCTEKTASKLFTKARGGKEASSEEREQFATFLMLLFGRWDAEKKWVKQLHLGASRNNNTRLLSQLGPDTGLDSIGDWAQVQSLMSYLDMLDRDGHLPKVIVYNNNPRDNYAIAAAIGNFQDGSIPGKLQFGSGWWFLDQKEGIEWQLNTLSNLGLLSRFVGMVTDSRSFMSYPRHEYFRRVLCNLIGQEAERGELPNDEALLGKTISDICYGNARDYLALPD
jgi:glucuronate isomerase